MSQVVVVVGANRGIGLEFTKQYHASGAKVFALCRKASDKLKDVGCEVIEGIDVGDDDIMASLANKINTEKIDVLIHNSGIGMWKSYDEMTMEELREQFEINTLGPLRVVRALETKLPAGSKVGLMSSRMGSVSDNSSGAHYGYRVSKAGLNMIGRSLSIDLKDKNIAVAILHPGFVQTDMTGNQGDITPDKAAAGLIAKMAEVSMENTGRFWHSNGEELPW